jgi:hypothetical protein
MVAFLARATSWSPASCSFLTASAIAEGERSSCITVFGWVGRRKLGV